MKTIVTLLLFFIVGCTTTKYVYVDPKDPNNIVEYKKRIIYDDLYYSSPRFYNELWFWDNPYYYRPGIVIPRRPIITPSPRIVQPRPTPQPSQRNQFQPRGYGSAPIREFKKQDK